MTVLRFLLALVPCLAPMALAAQDITDVPAQVSEIDVTALSDAELLELLARIEAGRAGPRPVTVFGIPSGFGAPHGLAFASGALTDKRDRRFRDWDASLALGFGLGDPERFLGLTTTLDITSVHPSDFGDSGKLGFKINRTFDTGPDWRGAAAISLQNVATWGDSDVLDRSWTMSYSALRPASATHPVPLMMNFGYGTGVSERGTEPGFFAGLGVGLREDLAVSAGWFGDEAIAAATFWPGDKKNLQISLGMGDIGDNVAGRRFLMAVSISKPFSRR